ncbi:DUF5131 family protein [Leptolyngbyaceae cyanobacterium CCMR0082]|uniref:DUF5131 family protein n=2 Tax=Adonisia TaxID=2950183 RepID=A0A6M0SAW9_9CYAN|nr:DUF5131 family protein [Adonisia turfae CCMR0082]
MNTQISWCDATWNPWIGCSKVSPLCTHCYAEEMMDYRYHRVQWGDEGTRDRTSEANWKLPYRWNRKAAKDPDAPRRVFCASLADFFEDRPELQPWREDAWKVIQETPHLIWLVLTKRPAQAADFLKVQETIPKGFWLGCSIGTQDEVEKHFEAIKAISQYAPIFLSLEPLLEQIDITRYLVELPRLWVIAGGESGPKARETSVNALMKVSEDCAEHEVLFFLKQLGKRPVWNGELMPLADSKGGNWDEWPSYLRIRQLPEFSDA